MTATADAEVWLRCFKPIDLPRLRLVTMPHAGGGPSTFRSWPAALPDDVEMLAVRYPGRQDRFLEDCIDRMDVLADRITESLTRYSSAPIVLFGHSMGASVAYEVAIRLEKWQGRPVQALVVSGQAPPHRARYRDAHLRGDEALLADVRSLGGQDTEALDHPDLRDLILPALRADYALLAGYRRDPLHVLRSPVTAYVGAHDEDVPVDEAARWADVTRGGFALRTFSGDHFYLNDRADEVITDLMSRLPGPRLGVG